jgi:6-phosphogluconolactonase
VLKVVIKYFLGAFKSRKAPLIPIMSNSTPTAQVKTTDYRLEIVNDPAEICRTAAGEIQRWADRTATATKPFTIALSGGSTPRGLHTLLANEPTIRDGLPWQNWHFFWGDERHVPPDHPQSNYRMAYDTLLSIAPVPAENIHRVPAEEPDAAVAAEKYEQELRAFFELEAGQLPRFDCILLGMGPDGHTASLFPATEALHETKRLVTANWVEKFKAYRITLTVPVLNRAGLVIFLVSGVEKAEALKEVLQGDYRPELFPAQLIQPGPEKLLWIVDRAAARLLINA